MQSFFCPFKPLAEYNDNHILLSQITDRYLPILNNPLSKFPENNFCRRFIHFEYFRGPINRQSFINNHTNQFLPELNYKMHTFSEI